MQEGWYDDRPRSFLVYAPSRTVIVYALAEDEQLPLKDMDESWNASARCTTDVYTGQSMQSASEQKELQEPL